MKKFTMLTFVLACLLTTVNVSGLTIATSITVVLDSNCHANFEYTQDSTSNLTFHFQSTSTYTGSITSFSWDFGDGTPPGATADPWHIYATPGTYLVCLTIHTSTGCVSNICKHVTAGGADCHALFVSHADSSMPLLIHFTDMSTATAGTVISWSWNFGDPSSGVNNVSALQNPDHFYSTAGNYYVCLIIHTSSGCTSDHCQHIEVSGGEGCHASFEAYPDSAPHQTHVHFISTSTGNFNSYLWNFGDPASGSSNTATTGDPWHTFTAPGTYNVCLTIHGDSCENTTCHEMTFGVPANCENTISYASNFLTVSFEGHTNSPYPTTYNWNMGDPASTNLTGQNVTFTYPAAGSYTVTLVTLDSTGCSWTRHLTIYVHATCDLDGNVRAGDNYVDHGFIQLIRIDSGNVMTVVDSKLFGDSMGSYHFGGVGPGHYYLKAEPTSASQYFGTYFPTYFEHSVNWAEANIIGLGQPDNPYVIHLVPAGGDSPGQGNIHGLITQGAKVNGNGTPVPGVEVLLLDGSGQPLTYVKTDDAGQFTFSEIALGSYKVYPEVVGKVTSPATFTLDNSVPSVNLVFSITQNNVTFGINDGLPKFISGISEIFPDPVSDRANISITATQNIAISLFVYNVTGQVMKEIKATVQKGKNVLTFNRSGLNAGCYYLKIQAADKGSAVRKFTVNK
jgi:PKD repeat protein